MLVYDVLQTEGKEPPEEFLKSGLGSDPFEIKGRISSKILDDAVMIAMSNAIRVILKPLSFFNAGYVTTIFKPSPPEIALKSGMAYENNLAVLIHELAHLFLGHTGHPLLKHKNTEAVIKEVKLIKRDLSLTVRELEAETISFLLCKKLGLETKSTQYLATHIRGDKIWRSLVLSW